MAVSRMELRLRTGAAISTELRGGKYGGGTVWKLASSGVLTVLHHFAGGTVDGAYPLAGLARDSKENLNGVTYYSGLRNKGQSVSESEGQDFHPATQLQLCFGWLLSRWSIDSRQKRESLWDCFLWWPGWARNSVEASPVVSAYIFCLKRRDRNFTFVIHDCELFDLRFSSI